MSAASRRFFDAIMTAAMSLESRHERPKSPARFRAAVPHQPVPRTVGPLFYRRDPERGLVIGLRIAEKHANARGIAHGGLLVTLADIALGYRTAFGQDPPEGLITANLTADFAGAAKIGDWVEAHVDVQKVGGRLAFANAFLWSMASASCGRARCSRAPGAADRSA